ncbi:uncharacterized protein DS421_3g105580 [Arachis hypogaea]|nr:uncharacterized protein DS421_3g105580 [Arachis hypogaea]
MGLVVPLRGDKFMLGVHILPSLFINKTFIDTPKHYMPPITMHLFWLHTSNDTFFCHLIQRVLTTFGHGGLHQQRYLTC